MAGARGLWSTLRSAHAGEPRLCLPWLWRSCCLPQRKAQSGFLRRLAPEGRRPVVGRSSPQVLGAGSAASGVHLLPGSCPRPPRGHTVPVAAHSHWPVLLPDEPYSPPMAACTGASCDRSVLPDGRNAAGVPVEGAPQESSNLHRHPLVASAEKAIALDAFAARNARRALLTPPVVAAASSAPSVKRGSVACAQQECAPAAASLPGLPEAQIRLIQALCCGIASAKAGAKSAAA
mmetsp:Transcript_64711/g.152133  ORF Transcript_64711/g.152133 Transcript_64711/m.152133 type:complete len:234 (-) Transcript_64711:1008-1709(-)